jgi:hypothetical protein
MLRHVFDRLAQFSYAVQDERRFPRATSISRRAFGALIGVLFLRRPLSGAAYAGSACGGFYPECSECPPPGHCEPYAGECPLVPPPLPNPSEENCWCTTMEGDACCDWECNDDENEGVCTCQEHIAECDIG